ncbi:hypothetical protein MTO96_034242, partial [Rhipicephalus appendiculatus]
PARSTSGHAAVTESASDVKWQTISYFPLVWVVREGRFSATVIKIGDAIALNPEELALNESRLVGAEEADHVALDPVRFF